MVEVTGRKPYRIFAFGKPRFAAISKCHFTMAADDPFRPGRFILLQIGQRRAVVPGHPLRGVGRQFLGMALQLRQIVKRVGAA